MRSALSTQQRKEFNIPTKDDLGALGNRINAETKQLHDQINTFVTMKFAIALRNQKVYRQGLQAFYHIFRHIEIALQREMEKDHEYSQILKEIYKPVLCRTEPLREDLMYFYEGQSQKFENPILPLQIEYAQYILESTKEKPYLLLAYMHVMYLALFAGVKILNSQVVKSLRLFPKVKGKSRDDALKKGTNFFTIDVSDTEELRAIYKRDYELQTRNNLSEDIKLEIIEESKYIFEMTGRIVKEIESHNMAKLQTSVTYQIKNSAHYVITAILMLSVCYFAKNMVAHILLK
ncbi:hypothetical protein KL930_001987 [Ogataea haglerorum]|uniref:Heme oxygenase n=1 Tax=Ogataea haglerorum TaxID=1937702 RepID=A0AAN6I300_9ASCO|nr:uncharacterized protein KL911_001928 [Ogataea haglerorum]KAG7698326.1 hypothetical protein KL915_002043 [Ogataea haglerorum]KAG7699381.1 hypothetical protein KL951_001098 [Ogataea haglerorum]KAG7708547.1 hypothetical protein KL914_002273 [Ogataea haglerorum]KAG7710425.1 hypothetical protein KL950_001338 [Ogataea haglerorum]KAG7721048.1 hypothetical protein KL913_000784 [Ogataea haglerorum]